MEIRKSESKSVSGLLEAQKNRPLLFMLAIALFAVIVALALYLAFAKSAIQAQQTDLDNQVATVTTQIDQLKAQNLEGQQFAKEWLATLEKTEIRWSQVIKTVQDLMPLDLAQKPRVAFLSYSGAAGGKLTLNAQTVAGSVDAYKDISTLLNVFNNSAFFKDGYVPSISHGVTQTGQDLLSFVFNVTYQEPLAGLSTSSTQQVVADPVKVPRATVQ